jgi:hypothetical protein
VQTGPHTIQIVQLGPNNQEALPNIVRIPKLLLDTAVLLSLLLPTACIAIIGYDFIYVLRADFLHNFLDLSIGVDFAFLIFTTNVVSVDVTANFFSYIFVARVTYHFVGSVAVFGLDVSFTCILVAFIYIIAPGPAVITVVRVAVAAATCKAATFVTAEVAGAVFTINVSNITAFAVTAVIIDID